MKQFRESPYFVVATRSNLQYYDDRMCASAVVSHRHCCDESGLQVLVEGDGGIMVGYSPHRNGSAV